MLLRVGKPKACNNYLHLSSHTPLACSLHGPGERTRSIPDSCFIPTLKISHSSLVRFLYQTYIYNTEIIAPFKWQGSSSPPVNSTNTEPALLRTFVIVLCLSFVFHRCIVLPAARALHAAGWEPSEFQSSSPSYRTVKVSIPFFHKSLFVVNKYFVHISSVRFFDKPAFRMGSIIVLK